MKTMIDCINEKGLYQDPKVVDDLVDLHQFICENRAKDYFFYFPDYTANLMLMQEVIYPDCEFVVGVGKAARFYEINTFPTLVYLLSENIDSETPLYFQIAGYLFQVKVKSIIPNW